jgi:phage terminase large subunit-like protein
MTEILEAVPPEKAALLAQAFSQLPARVQRRLRYDWRLHARPAQMPPSGEDWYVWLILAGRGFGKTRAGAEFIRGEVEAAQRRGRPIRAALVAPTAADARDIMVEGDSGMLGVCPPDNMPKYESSKRRLTWKDGSIATLFSAEEAERLRGPQHHVGWADELAAWSDLDGTWDMLGFGMRLIRGPGLGPRLCVTTTPKPRPYLVKIMRDLKTRITTGSTYDNKANLAPAFFENVISNYEGTRLGRQEIAGEVLLDNLGALWTNGLIDQHRVRPEDVPPLVRVVVAVDPSVSEAEGADSGVIVAGADERGEVYVLEDCSVQGTPTEWARTAIAAAIRHQADKIVAEANNGGAMVENVLRSAVPPGSALFKFKLVYASRGKITRAEPVSALYERGKVHHVGMHGKLEDQMVSYSPEMAGKMLVDRMDALVWAVTELAVRHVGTVTKRNMFS